MKTIRFNKNFDVRVPDEWEYQKDDNITSLFNAKGGVGALQFSFHSISNIETDNLDEILKNFLEDKHGQVKITQTNNNPYFSIIDEDKIYWRYWLFKSITDVIFVSYNCELTDKGKEDGLVDSIIESINIQA